MKPKALILDDDPQYRDKVLSLLGDGWNVFETDSVDQALENLARDTVLVVLDNRSSDGGSYWKELLPRLRSKAPTTWVLLVSQLEDGELTRDAEPLTAIPGSKEMLESDPWVSYLPKGERHFESLKAFADSLLSRQAKRLRLVQKMFQAAIKASHRLHSMKIKELGEEVPHFGKVDTKRMDIITEEFIHECFLPEMHFANVIICTEERGSHNRLFHRVQSPDFFVFSDPFDGSTPFKEFVEQIEKLGKAELQLKEVIEDADLMEKWETTWGSRSLNSPMVSVVVSERHSVIGAVLVNLFTRDVYLSIDNGNYSRRFSAFDDTILATSLPASPESPATTGWQTLKFDDNLPGPTDLFLCSLGAKKLRSGKPSSHYKAAEQAIRPILPRTYSWAEAINERFKQGDFTPGPGRILFLTTSPAAAEYGRSHPCYNTIASAGEPVTEWIGWLAFLRHVPNASAFCLRTRNASGSTSTVKDKRTEADPASMMPDELASIFREGFIDLCVLSSGYGSKMRLYNDTFIVIRNEDEEWRKSLFDDKNQERFVRIPLHNQSLGSG